MHRMTVMLFVCLAGCQEQSPVPLEKSSQETLTLKGHTHWISSVSFSPDGTRLASASNDNSVKLWDAATGQELHTLKGHTVPVACVCFGPDGTRLASASFDRTAKVWDVSAQ